MPFFQWKRCGKTELAKALAHIMFGSELRLFRVDMAALKNEGAVSTLIGAPAGYRDSEKGGTLTGFFKGLQKESLNTDSREQHHLLVETRTTPRSPHTSAPCLLRQSTWTMVAKKREKGEDTAPPRRCESPEVSLG